MDLVVGMEDLAALLRGTPVVGEVEQAFPFLTVDDDGYPHACMLSRTELAASIDSRLVVAVLRSPRTRHNILRDNAGLLIAIDGDVAHYVKLTCIQSEERSGLLVCTFRVGEHKRDSIGIRMEPISFRPTVMLAENEHWTTSATLVNEALEKASMDHGGPQ